VLQRLQKKHSVDIVDYGCGLAHRSIAVARKLSGQGVPTKLYLLDIPKPIHRAFLRFLCEKYSLSHEFIDVTSSQQLPPVPTCDYCDAVSVFEHLPDPVAVLGQIDQALRADGLLLATVDDEEDEMMHVSPDLSAARRRLQDSRYEPIARCGNAVVFSRQPQG
jgi:SAM-dependent methyltransferase